MKRKVGRYRFGGRSWWFIPVALGKRRKHRATRSLADEFIDIHATPLGLDVDEIPVGLAGLQQDWQRVGEFLGGAMGWSVSREL